MDDRPIGVFDSGLGGLTAVRRLMRVLPGEDIIYLGDTGRVPYGGRSRETIVKYARQDMAFLEGFDIKAAIVACGTVSSTALGDITPGRGFPVFGVVNPGAEAAVRATKNGKIGIIGTAASIKSGAYEKPIRRALPEAELICRACPLLVPLVENGRILPGDPLAEIAVSEYLSEIKNFGVDTLILGCTHYPLLEPVIAAFMGEGVTLIDTGAETAAFVRDYLRSHSLETSRRAGSQRYFVTDTTEGFEDTATLFLGRDIHGMAEKTDVSGL